MLGTLGWASPEQVLGRRCSFPADIWSLGVILWEVATGEAPRRGRLREPTPDEAPLEGAAPAAAAAAGAGARLLCGGSAHGGHSRGSFGASGAAVMPACLPGLPSPATVRSLIQECMRQDPAQRPTAEQVAARLQQLLGDAASPAAEPGSAAPLSASTVGAVAGSGAASESVQSVQAGPTDSGRSADDHDPFAEAVANPFLASALQQT